MTLEQRITNLENLVFSFIQNQSKIDEYKAFDVNGCRNSIDNITPYTETKKAYIGDTICSFTKGKEGIVLASVVDENGIQLNNELVVEDNTINVMFEALTKVATVTISIQ